MSRIRQSPGIELHEIDKSQYDSTTDNSTIGTATLVLGFADKGDNYDVKWINSIKTLQNVYGTPTTNNEAEKYFYNACTEVINDGGVLYAARLPYDNNSLDKYQYVDYSIDSEPTMMYSIRDLDTQVTSTSVIDILSFAGMDVLINLLSAHGHYFTYGLQNYLGNFIKVYIEDETDYSELMTDSVSSLGTIQEIFSGSEDISARIPYEYDQIRNRFSTYENLVNSFVDQTDSTTFVNYMLSCEEIFKVHSDPGSENYIEEVCEYYSSISSDYNTIRELIEIQQFIDIKQFDNKIEKYVNITNNISSNGMMTMEQYDNLLIDDLNVVSNSIRIVNIARTNLEKDDDVFGNEIIGYMPVITTAANALYFSKTITASDNLIKKYGVLRKITTNRGYEQTLSGGFNTAFDGDYPISSFVGLYNNLGTEENKTFTRTDDTVTKKAVDLYPNITYRNGHVDYSDLKKIGLVVFRVFKDVANENKLGFLPVESFIGSLGKDDIDPVTKASTFIETVVNNNSNLVNIFVHVSDDLLKGTDIFTVNNQYGTVLGFKEDDIQKTISLETSILKAMDRIFESCKDVNTFDLDLVVDAGVSTIGQFIQTITNNPKYNVTTYAKQSKNLPCGCPSYETIKLTTKKPGKFDLTSDDAKYFKLTSSSDITAWKQIVTKFDEFCKVTRKDCMFLCDAPRSVCLEGNQKLVRKTQSTRTVTNTILPKMKFVYGAINSSYSAGYCNWFMTIDSNSGDYFWCPPSIKALGRYLYTDSYANYWNAPAGMNRGVIQDAYDISFNPTDDETWDIYSNQWNYALSYPLQGIVLEGQKTFQINKTALDRVNVRRLMLGLEKVTRNYAKYFNYEQNNEWNRERLVDILDNYFQEVQTGSGISEYVIICDERNNNTQTIENNELHVTIAVKPIKAIEFIILNFVCTNQSANVTETAEETI